MDRNAVIERIGEELRVPSYVAKRIGFRQQFGSRFDAFFKRFDEALRRLSAGRSALPLYLLDAVPREVLAPFIDLPAEERGRLAKEIVARGFDSLPQFITRVSLPEGVLELYPTTIRYIVRTIAKHQESSYGHRESSFDRDLRIAAGFTLPAGAQIVDRRCWIPSSFYRNMGMKENFRCLSFIVFRLGGRGPLFRMHTETRNMIDFNESGWKACYMRIANLMKLMPEVKGVIGTSWFFDRQLETISPNLSFIRRIPEEGGAFLRIDGPGEIHTQRAITLSQHRRILYEQGKYLPLCVTIVWPKENLLRWAMDESGRPQF